MYAVNIAEAVYEHGNCDFCKQREVKVKPLLCKRHFYCRTCNDFSPKFQRGELQCRVCSERLRQRTEKSFKIVDSFLDAETSKGMNKNSDMAVGVDGELISFDANNTKEDSDDDLTGNNDEWEHLLQIMSTEDRKEMKTSTHGHKKKKSHEKHLSLVPRDVSFLKLVLPSAEPSAYSASGCSSAGATSFENKSTSKTNQQTTFSQGQEDENFNDLESLHENSLTMVESFTEDQDEVERGTSPVKSPRKKNAWGWVPDSKKFEESEDDHYGFLIDIEGPLESPRLSDYGESLHDDQHDDFWDF